MQKGFFALMLLLSVNVWAQSDDVDYTIHQPYISIRAMASGNSFTGVEDYNLLFYNPAGLARLQEGELNLGFGVGVSPSALTFAKDIESASKLPEDQKVSKVNDLLSAAYGKVYSTRLPMVNGIWVRPKWGVGMVLGDVTARLFIHQAGAPAIGVSAYADNTLAFGYSKSFMEEALTAGVTAKVVYRGYVGRDFSALDLAADPSFFKPKDAKEGMTIDFDLASQYEMPTSEGDWLNKLNILKLNWAFAVRNVIDYGFKQNMHLIHKDSGNEPPKLGRRFDIGQKLSFKNLWVFTPKFMFDVRDIGHRHWTFLKGLHTGLEMEWNALSWLRGHYGVGLSQGYFTFGAGAELAWFRLDLATYAEETGTSNAKKENRMYMAKASLNF